jgi:uncharacterized membrane protein
VESHRRSIAKALSWRLLGMVFTAIVVLMVTGRLSFAATIGVADFVVKLGVYYVHERVWNRVRFGKANAPEYQI